MDALSHVASIEVAASADQAFAFLADRTRLNQWSFGTWRTTLHDDGLVEGRAIFDDSVTWVRIDADQARLAIDYHLGRARDALCPRISARVVPGDRLDLQAEHCVITLIAWRTRTMSDERWRRLTAAHEFEIHLLKSLIERG